jgi:hypothetical protein
MTTATIHQAFTVSGLVNGETPRRMRSTVCFNTLIRKKDLHLTLNHSVKEATVTSQAAVQFVHKVTGSTVAFCHVPLECVQPTVTCTHHWKCSCSESVTENWSRHMYCSLCCRYTCSECITCNDTYASTFDRCLLFLLQNATLMLQSCFQCEDLLVRLLILDSLEFDTVPWSA